MREEKFEEGKDRLIDLGSEDARRRFLTEAFRNGERGHVLHALRLVARSRYRDQVTTLAKLAPIARHG